MLISMYNHLGVEHWITCNQITFAYWKTFTFKQISFVNMPQLETHVQNLSWENNVQPMIIMLMFGCMIISRLWIWNQQWHNTNCDIFTNEQLCFICLQSFYLQLFFSENTNC
jgi:hypothetical protein